MEGFIERNKLTNILSDNIDKILNQNDVEIIPFGFENIAKNKPYINKFIYSAESNLSHSAMMVKFLPDFILLKKTNPQEIYFLEIKASITPLWSTKNLNQIKENHKDIKLSDIGIIAREAWNAYRTLFPNTIILSACSYNPNIIKAQFVDKIKCLRCYDSSLGHCADCSSCPLNNHSFFEVKRNLNSAGSGTPHTNLDLSSFVDVSDFFNSIGIRINHPEIERIKNIFKDRKIELPSHLYPYIKEKIINQLKAEGCDWLWFLPT